MWDIRLTAGLNVSSLVQRYFDTRQISCFSSYYCLLTLVSLIILAHKSYCFSVFLIVIFYFHHSSHIYLLEIYKEYLFIQLVLCKYWLMVILFMGYDYCNLFLKPSQIWPSKCLQLIPVSFQNISILLWTLPYFLEQGYPDYLVFYSMIPGSFHWKYQCLGNGRALCY